MKYSFAALSMIIVGMLAFLIVVVFQDVTVNNEADYYSLKEAMEASMIESIDASYYMKTGELKIVEQKFVSNFSRRFVKGTMGDTEGYVLEFYDIMESPPKATIVIKNATNMMVISEEDMDVINNLTGILEATVDRNSIIVSNTDDTDTCDVICEGSIKTKTKTLDYYSSLVIGNSTSYLLSDDRLKSAISEDNIVGLRISKVKFVDYVTSANGINQGNSYKYYGKDSNWRTVGNSTKNLAGIKENNCYATGAKISIDNALGDYQYRGNNYFRISVNTMYDSNSISGCQGDIASNNVLVKYQITWKYDYCVE